MPRYPKRIDTVIQEIHLKPRGVFHIIYKDLSKCYDYCQHIIEVNEISDKADNVLDVSNYPIIRTVRRSSISPDTRYFPFIVGSYLVHGYFVSNNITAVSLFFKQYEINTVSEDNDDGNDNTEGLSVSMEYVYTTISSFNGKHFSDYIRDSYNTNIRFETVEYRHISNAYTEFCYDNFIDKSVLLTQEEFRSSPVQSLPAPPAPYTKDQIAEFAKLDEQSTQYNIDKQYRRLHKLFKQLSEFNRYANILSSIMPHLDPDPLVVIKILLNLDLNHQDASLIFKLAYRSLETCDYERVRELVSKRIDDDKLNWLFELTSCQPIKSSPVSFQTDSWRFVINVLSKSNHIITTITSIENVRDKVQLMLDCIIAHKINSDNFEQYRTAIISIYSMLQSDSQNILRIGLHDKIVDYRNRSQIQSLEMLERLMSEIRQL